MKTNVKFNTTVIIMRAKQNPTLYIKVFGKSTIHAESIKIINKEFKQAIQNLDEETCCYLVLQTAIYPNHMMEMVKGNT